MDLLYKILYHKFIVLLNMESFFEKVLLLIGKVSDITSVDGQLVPRFFVDERIVS